MIWAAVGLLWVIGLVVAVAIARAGAGKQKAESREPAGAVEVELRSAAAIRPQLSIRPQVRGYGALLLKRLVVQACRISGADQVVLLVLGRDADSFVPVAVHGADEELVGERIAAALEPFAELRDSRRALLAPAWRYPALTAIVPDARLAAIAPVLVNGAVGGFLVAGSSDGGTVLGRTEIRVLTELGDLAAGAIGDAVMHEQLDATIGGGAAALCAALERHLAVPGEARADVIPLALEVGRRLGLDAAALIELELAAHLYEAGRLVSVPPRAPRGLDGPLRLDAHARAAATLLAEVPGLQAVAIVVDHVGARWDGCGEQDALAGDRIPLASRILAACAAFERTAAFGDDGAPAGARRALHRLEARAGHELDPVVVAALAAALGAPAGAVEAVRAEWAAGDAEELPALGGGEALEPAAQTVRR